MTMNTAAEMPAIRPTDKDELAKLIRAIKITIIIYDTCNHYY